MNTQNTLTGNFPSEPQPENHTPKPVFGSPILPPPHPSAVEGAPPPVPADHGHSRVPAADVSHDHATAKPQSSAPAPAAPDTRPAAKVKNPPKAYENMDFLHSPYGRPVRVLSEFIEPQQRMKRFRVRNTVVFFGSARILPADAARDAFKKAEAAAAALPEADAASALDKARRAVELSAFYEAARQLAGDITRWSKTLPRAAHPFFICSGGGPGIMEAANRGASEAGGITLGLGISLPYEQVNNPYITQGLSFEFHYFFIRKYWLITLARALVVFPGGFGTLDEMCEILTLVQTRKIIPVPIILFGERYWREVINFKALADWGVIDEEDNSLFHIVNTVEEARRILFEHLTRYYQANLETVPHGDAGAHAAPHINPHAAVHAAPHANQHAAIVPHAAPCAAVPHAAPNRERPHA